MIQIKKNKILIINFFLFFLGILIFYKISQKDEFTYFLDRVSFYFLISSASFFLSIFFASTRFFYILKKKIEFKRIFILNLKSFFFYFFLPVGIGSDIYRFNFLKESLNKSKFQILNYLLFDRLIGLLSFLMLSLIFFSMLIEKYILLTIFLITPIIIAVFNYYLSKFPQVKSDYFNNINIKDIYSILISSIISQLLLIISIFLVIYFNEIVFSIINCGFIISFSSILSLIPLSLLGLSATELSSYTLYTYYGLNESESLFLTLNHYFLKFLFSIIGGVYFFTEKINSKKLVNS